jgi:hypothetical protein
MTVKTSTTSHPLSVKPQRPLNIEAAAEPSTSTSSPFAMRPGTVHSLAATVTLGQLSEQLQRIGAALTSIFSRAHLLWPGKSWSTFQVVLVDSNQRRAWLWNDQSLGLGQGGLAEIDFQALPAPLKEMLGNETFRGNPAMSVDLALFPDAESQTSAPSFIIHELFHKRIQEPTIVLPAQPETDRWPRYPQSAFKRCDAPFSPRRTLSDKPP